MSYILGLSLGLIGALSGKWGKWMMQARLRSVGHVALGVEILTSTRKYARFLSCQHFQLFELGCACFRCGF